MIAFQDAFEADPRMIASPDAFDGGPQVTGPPGAFDTDRQVAPGGLDCPANGEEPAKTETGASVVGETERLGDEIARLAAHLHAATYHLLVLIREFDEREGWGGGFLSCAHWLSWRTGISPGPAREKVRAAKALAVLPLISGAMARGELSYSKVRALTRVATPDNEADLLEVARHATAAQVERLVRSWRRVDRLQKLEGAGEEERRHQSRYLRLCLDDDGSYVIRGRLDPEVGALLEKALEWGAEALYRRVSDASALEETDRSATERTGASAAADSTGLHSPSFEQRWADAMGLLAERALAAAATDDGPNSRAERFQVVVHVEADARAVSNESCGEACGESGVAGPGEPCEGGLEEMNGPPLRGETFPRKRERGDRSPSEAGGPVRVMRYGSGFSENHASRRIACDSSVVVMTHDDEGQVLDVGRRRRTVPPAIRRALEHRDGECRFPGCGCRYTDAHHLTHWAEGGETRLENLILLCRRHHRALHEGGFRMEVGCDAGSASGPGSGRSGNASGGLRFFGPSGQEIPEFPTPPPAPTDPAGTLTEANAARGVEPDDWTATPLWQGESLDYGLSIDMFRVGFG
jgi:hypothetical protein